MKFTVYFDKEQSLKHFRQVEHLNPFSGARPFSDKFQIDSFAVDVGIDLLAYESMMKLTLAYGDAKIEWSSKSLKTNESNSDLLASIANKFRIKAASWLLKSEKIKNYIDLAIEDYSSVHFIAECSKDCFNAKCAFEQVIAKKHNNGNMTISYSDPYYIATKLTLN